MMTLILQDCVHKTIVQCMGAEVEGVSFSLQVELEYSPLSLQVARPGGGAYRTSSVVHMRCSKTQQTDLCHVYGLIILMTKLTFKKSIEVDSLLG